MKSVYQFFHIRCVCQTVRPCIGKRMEPGGRFFFFFFFWVEELVFNKLCVVCWEALTFCRDDQICLLALKGNRRWMAQVGQDRNRPWRVRNSVCHSETWTRTLTAMEEWWLGNISLRLFFLEMTHLGILGSSKRWYRCRKSLSLCASNAPWMDLEKCYC